MKKYLFFVVLATSFIQLTSQTNTHSLSFTNQEDYVNCGSSSSLNPASQISFQSNFKIDQIPALNGMRTIIGRNSDVSSQYAYNYGLIYTSGQWQLRTGVGDYGGGFNVIDVQTPVTINVGTWYNFASTFDGDTLKMYLNGILQHDTVLTLAGGLYQNSFNTYIGRYRQISTNQDFFGKLDDVSIWSKALSQLEVQQYWDCPPTGNEIGLVGHWDFEEGSGIVTLDQTSNGNHGALSGPTWSTDAPTHTCNSGVTEFVEPNFITYPNPSSDKITIEIPSTITGLCVLTNMLGQNIFVTNFSSNIITLDLNRLSSKGTYFITIIDSETKYTLTKKIIYQ